MSDALVLCGGTGAHVGLAFLRFHTLGFALGFFDREAAERRRAPFPKIYLVDQDAGDGESGDPTAWQLARRLIELHPGRFDWQSTLGRPAAPELVNISPLPVGANNGWYRPPHNVLERRFESSPLLPVLAAERQRRIDYSKGMMGSPAIGSLLFKLKEYDEVERAINQDKTFGQLLDEDGRLVVAGSGVGGTGASVAPTLALRLAERPEHPVMAVMVLNWFYFDEEDPNLTRRARAALRNRILHENANSALEFYGQALARRVAALPVGIPEAAQLKRAYTGDVGQPKRESFVHAVAALGSMRHLLRNQAYGPGLYAMGAVDRGELEGGTGIPGGTLQDLANQAATLAEMLDAWRGVLGTSQSARVIPALHSAFRRSGFDPAQVAQFLEREIGQYREHLGWLEETLGVVPQPYRGLTRELQVRRRLAESAHALPLREGMRPEEAPFALFRWTADWIREIASTTNGLEILRHGATGVYWPDTKSEGIGVAAGESGELTRVPDQNIAAVLESFVDRDALSANGWPHPLAAADYFRHAIERRDPVAVRQLELLLIGLLAGRFEPRPLWPGAPNRSISLEFLTAELRREGFPGLAEIGLYDRARDNVLIGFSSPHTLLCPVPYMDDEADHRIWQEIWTTLSGSTDGAAWQNAKTDWSGREREARQARAWIEDLKRRRGGVPPPWTRAFEGLASGGAPRWGAGHRIEVYWGTTTGEPALIWLELPTRDASDRWSAPAGAGTLDLDELEKRVPGLSAITDEAGTSYERFTFQKPGRPLPVEAIWRDHLDALQRQERIYRWTKNERGELVIAMLEGDQVNLATLAGVEVLALPEISILECVPWVQDPVPGSEASSGGIRFPDLPLKTEYLDLALSAENGETLERYLELRHDLRSFQFSPGRRVDAQGRLVLHWDLRLRGRSASAACEIRLEGRDGRPFEASQTAHLMVWPNFRDPGRLWRAYYVYCRCSDPAVGTDVVWLDSDRRLGLLTNDRATDEPFPVGYSTGEKAGHSAGPPIALALRHHGRQRDLGLYLVPLKALPQVKVDVQLAVDFGTSHTVAAYSIGDQPARVVDLLPELQAGVGERSLSCHLSEDWAHVTANEQAAGLLATAAWLPTYRDKRNESLLPSELLLARTIRDAQSQSISDWRPLTDYTIPPLDISRSDLGDFLLADFKWNSGSEEFRGREPELRGCYLGLFLEMVAAEVVAHQLRGLTERPIPLTFTYPLRVSEPDLKTLQETLRTALERARRSLGLQFMLKDNEGLYDESRAARLDTKKFGDLCVVADLGGGTLDLYIAANNGDKELQPVADSARLGGNLLLHQLADPEGKFLPADGHWFTGANGRDTETKLRAWMRTEGSSRLFGVDAGGRPEMKALGLVGFAKPAESARARKLIDRYFRLIVEYMARSLVGFLTKQWYPHVEPESWDRLRITVQLRGNGWRLQYNRLDPTALTRTVQDAVRERVVALWNEAPDNPYPAPTSDSLWETPSKFEIGDAKTAPIRSVLGRATMQVGDALGNWYTHLLVNLEIQKSNRKFLRVPWTESVPFATGGSTRIEIREVEPPLPLSGANSDERSEIRDLDARQQRKINASLQEEEGALDGSDRMKAPVGALVWEAVFDSRSLWP